MTPQERALVDDLFSRLAKLESAPRDADAEQAIRSGVGKAPHALYALVQSVLVQDEALKRADARIRELEGGDVAADDGRPRGFLDNMRDALFGGGNDRRGSVPSVRPAPVSGPAAYAQPAYAQPAYAQPSYSSGSSFLGTAAAAAAGMIGGSLLLGSIRSMLGNSYNQNQGAFANTFDQVADSPSNAASSPWSDASNSDLARDAGINNIGSSNAASDDSSRSQGLFDTASNDASYDDASFNDDVGFDSGGDTA